MKEQTIAQAFLPLCLNNTSLSQAIVNFVLHGQDLGCLSTLEAQNDQDNVYLLANVGSIFPYFGYHYGGTPPYEAINRSKIARDTLYREWTSIWSLPEIKRFMQVIAAACQGINLDMGNTQLPIWFGYLFYDGLYCSCNDNGNVVRKNRRHLWSIADLMVLLQLDHGAVLDEDILLILFEQHNLSDGFLNPLPLIHFLPDSAKFISERLSLFKTLPSLGLSASGQLVQLAYVHTKPQYHAQLADFFVTAILSKNKTVAAQAQIILKKLAIEDYAGHLQAALLSKKSHERSKATELLANHAPSLKHLQTALASEKNATVRQKIQAIVMVLDNEAHTQDLDQLIAPAFTPQNPLLLPDSAKIQLSQLHRTQLSQAQEAAVQEQAKNHTTKYPKTEKQAHYQSLLSIHDDELSNLVDFLNGQAKQKYKKSKLRPCFEQYILSLSTLPEFGHVHYLRAQAYTFDDDPDFINNTPDGSLYLDSRDFDHLIVDVDLRQIAHDFKIGKHFLDVKRHIAEQFLSPYNHGEAFLESNADCIWPFFVENHHYVDEALGFKAASNKYHEVEFNASLAMDLLQHFPVLPANYAAKITEWAFGDSKTMRQSAQDLLSTQPNAHLQAQEALQSGKQNIRIAAAKWLEQLAQKSTIPALYAALKKEKREMVRAAILTTLESMGEDLSPYLSPDVLLAEAVVGLSSDRPSCFEWFDASTIPPLTWQDGTTVDVRILEWWLVLAVKLKEPTSNTLLQRYVEQLSLASQKTLAMFCLLSFIQTDTFTIGQAEARRQAKLDAPARVQYHHNLAHNQPEQYGHLAHYTLAQAINDIEALLLHQSRESGMPSKGMLALCRGIEGVEAVQHIRHYMKNHHTRRPQIEAMLSAVATHTDDKIIIQLLLSISENHRLNSVQYKADDLLEDIAEHHGWSEEELEDYNIPLAQLDMDGVLNIDYGNRIFYAKLDHLGKLSLFTADNKSIKALPEAKQDEDEALIKAAKKQLAACKKELKQTIDAQTDRLHAQMLSQRARSVKAWQECLQQHPIMRMLINRLLWLNVDENMQVLQIVRACDDGSVINIHDDEVRLPANSYMVLVHGALLNETDRQAWHQHLQDYKIVNLFNQLDTLPPDLDVVSDGNTIANHHGWVTDTFTLRKILKQHSFERGDIGDSATFTDYRRYFGSHNIEAIITFSGSYVPENNIDAVIYGLRFLDCNKNFPKSLNTSQVPALILAEAYAAYVAIANASLGFDANWPSKLPW